MRVKSESGLKSSTTLHVLYILGDMFFMVHKNLFILVRTQMFVLKSKSVNDLMDKISFWTSAVRFEDNQLGSSSVKEIFLDFSLFIFPTHWGF